MKIKTITSANSIDFDRLVGKFYEEHITENSVFEKHFSTSSIGTINQSQSQFIQTAGQKGHLTQMNIITVYSATFIISKKDESDSTLQGL